MTEAATAGRRGRTPRWVLVLLVVSLAVNLLVIGGVAGAVWRFRAHSYVAGSVTPNLIGYASTLPRQRRAELWEATAEERRQLMPLRREVRAAREATIKALVADPFDKERFMAAQAHQAEVEGRAREGVRLLYGKLAEALTAEERRAFPGWRSHRRPPGYRNLLDEPDQQAGDPLR